ncbi:MAG: ferritin [Flavobacteriales bacterium]|nr:ferritin [Flavobacteriales bacterium]MCB9448957.1 ferritin [Flavobacteriales bacterium]
MLSKKIEKALNDQVGNEAEAAFFYLAMASWCEGKSLEGCAAFLYRHFEEEKDHMLRLIHYINDAGGDAAVPAIKKQTANFSDIKAVFQTVLKHEIAVTTAINKLVDMCLKERDYSTHNFLQWYVAEQHEEEKLFRTVLDKIDIIGTDAKGLYWIDQEVGKLNAALAASEAGA